MIFLVRDYKECLKDFVREFNSLLGLGLPEDLGTAVETNWVKYLLDVVPAYVDMYLDGAVGGASIDTLQTVGDCFDLVGVIGCVEVVLSYDLRTDKRLHVCGFLNRLTGESLLLELENGELVESSADLAECGVSLSDSIQRRMFDIFD